MNTRAEMHKKEVRQVFDSLAPGYDCAATRFFPFTADRLLDFVRPRPGSRVLDVATGTGVAAVAFAQAVRPGGGRVTVIDLSGGMLDRAEANIRKMALDNVDLHEMDAEHLDFRADYFHYVVCSYGLFFIPDMVAALREWVRVLQPGGKLAFTCFETTAFQPMLDDFVERLQAFGVQLPEGPFGSRRITSLQHCSELLDTAGLVEIDTECRQTGYHLADENDWWAVVSNTAIRALFDQVPDDRKAEFRAQHLAYVATRKNDEGLWMDVQTRFASGIKPAGAVS
ncbi:MAG TPA: methyltransferase domain-containing protein [Gammaproteobacteria bacterium]|nr:methyltransferase domain-containing protein [Gammaproteobacteria bacterium]